MRRSRPTSASSSRRRGGPRCCRRCSRSRWRRWSGLRWLTWLLAADAVLVATTSAPWVPVVPGVWWWVALGWVVLISPLGRMGTTVLVARALLRRHRAGPVPPRRVDAPAALVHRVVGRGRGGREPVVRAVGLRVRARARRDRRQERRPARAAAGHGPAHARQRLRGRAGGGPARALARRRRAAGGARADRQARDGRDPQHAGTGHARRRVVPRSRPGPRCSTSVPPGELWVGSPATFDGPSRRHWPRDRAPREPPLGRGLRGDRRPARGAARGRRGVRAARRGSRAAGLGDVGGRGARRPHRRAARRRHHGARARGRDARGGAPARGRDARGLPRGAQPDGLADLGDAAAHGRRPHHALPALLEHGDLRLAAGARRGHRPRRRGVDRADDPVDDLRRGRRVPGRRHPDRLVRARARVAAGRAQQGGQACLPGQLGDDRARPHGAQARARRGPVRHTRGRAGRHELARVPRP